MWYESHKYEITWFIYHISIQLSSDSIKTLKITEYICTKLQATYSSACILQVNVTIFT